MPTKADAFLQEAKPVLENLRQILLKHEISFVFAAALDDEFDPEFLGAKQLAVVSALDENFPTTQLLIMMYKVWRSMAAQKHRTDFGDIPLQEKGPNHARNRRRK